MSVEIMAVVAFGGLFVLMAVLPSKLQKRREAREDATRE